MANQFPCIRVIYIGGAEHNGSTFLGTAIGNHPEVTCVGELSMLPREGWCRDYSCSCGLRILECPFWTQVRNQWEKNTNNDINELVALEDAVDRNRRLPRLILRKYMRSQDSLEYALKTRTLFRAIQNVSDNSIIVDTSKRFSRALALSMVDGIDLRLIHLVRDARGVAYSWTKYYRPKRRGWLDASFRWNMTNGIFDLLKRFISEDRVLLIRYEDLISKPENILNEIGDFINLDLSSVSKMIKNGDSFILEHMGVGNNFLRRKESVTLKTKIDWPQKMSRADQRKVWLLTSRIMRRYGYNP